MLDYLKKREKVKKNSVLNLIIYFYEMTVVMYILIKEIKKGLRNNVRRARQVWRRKNWEIEWSKKLHRSSGNSCGQQPQCTCFFSAIKTRMKMDYNTLHGVVWSFMGSFENRWVFSLMRTIVFFQVRFVGQLVGAGELISILASNQISIGPKLELVYFPDNFSFFTRSMCWTLISKFNTKSSRNLHPNLKFLILFLALII